MKYYNHTSVQIVDGCFEAWAKTNTPTQKIAAVEPTTYKIENQNEQIVTNLDFVQKHLHDTNVKLIDGRPADQFSGEKPGTVFHAGKNTSTAATFLAP